MDAFCASAAASDDICEIIYAKRASGFVTKIPMPEKLSAKPGRIASIWVN